MKNFLNIEEDTLSIGKFLLLMLIAYTFALSVRFIWINQVKNIEQYKWNNEIIINNVDGFYYAEGARDILVGNHQNGDGSPIDSAASILTAALVKILPFSFETIILYLPAFFGSLLIIPLMLIGRGIKQDYIGFIAAILGSTGVSYYNRTMVGYYDTDMLTIALPVCLLASLIYALIYNKNRYLLYAPLIMLAYQYWYAAGYSILFAMTGMLLLYTLIKELKKAYNYKLFSFMLITLTEIPFLFKIGIIGLLYLGFLYFKDKYDKYIAVIPILSAVLFFSTNGLAPIWDQLKVYVVREKVTPSLEDAISLHFFSVKQTIQEAGNVSFPVFTQRISGNLIIFLLSTIGCLLMFIRYPMLLLGLPMMGLGFLALKAGLRFTIYAVPINALGIGYISFLLSRYFKTLFADNMKKYITLSTVSVITIAGLYLNVNHIIDYKKGPVVLKEEAASLDKLNKITNREDYVLSWWDYGYPIRYYSDTKTLGDGGRQNGDTNFPLSFVLSKEQTPAANMARIAVEFNSDTAAAMKAYNFVDANDFLKALDNKKFALPQKKQDIYLYLPFRIIQNQILGTVWAFSNLDIMTGQLYKPPLFYQTQSFEENNDTINIGGFTLHKADGTIERGKQKNRLNSFIAVGYDKDRKLDKKITNYDPSSDLYVIYMQSYGQAILMEKKVYDSLFIRLFVLEDYDPELFEPVIIDPWTKIYRVKK